MITWATLIKQSSARLAEAGVPSPDYDSRELAEFVHGSQPMSLTPVLPQEKTEYEAAISAREARAPLQLITGTMYFRYLTLTAKLGCFIVRPETELVAGAAIEAARAISGPALVVDLCTGSGAIALALATEVPDSTVIGVEVSKKAFVVAEENNAKYGNVVDLRLGDALTECEELRGKVDVVVSNPPYVPNGVVHSPEVNMDPPVALWGGRPDGLAVPGALVRRSATLLKKGGILVMEHAEEQGEALQEIAREAGFSETSTGRDFTDRPRWLRAKL